MYQDTAACRYVWGYCGKSQPPNRAGRVLEAPAETEHQQLLAQTCLCASHLAKMETELSPGFVSHIPKHNAVPAASLLAAALKSGATQRRQCGAPRQGPPCQGRALWHQSTRAATGPQREDARGGTGDLNEHTCVPTPAIPRGHRHIGYCHGSCDRGVRGVDASGLLAAPAGQSKMPKSLLSSAGAGPLPAGGGRCSGQEVPIALGSTGKPAPAGRAPPCHPGVPGSPLPSGAGGQAGGLAGCRELTCLRAWRGRAAVPGACRRRRGCGHGSSGREGRRAAGALPAVARAHGGAARGCGAAGVSRYGPLRGGGAGSAAWLPARPCQRGHPCLRVCLPRRAWCVCTCPAVCAWGSPAAARRGGEALPSWGLRGWKRRPLGAVSRGARVASPKLPVRPFFPWEPVPGREMVLLARPHPACLLPRRGSAWPGAARGCPGGGEAICERRRRRRG